MNTVSYSDHDPRESFDYKLGQKEAWAEFRKMIRTELHEAWAGRSVAETNLLGQIDAKLSSFKEGESV